MLKKNKLRRLLSGLLTICMMLTMLPAMTFGAAAAGNTIYVSNTGNDDSGDGSESAPYLTVQAAYDAAGSGDIITLRESVDVEERILMAENKAVTLTGEGGAELTYIGSTPIHNGTEGFLTVTAGELTITNLTVQLPDQKGTNGRVLYVSDATVNLQDGATIANGYLAYAGGGVRIDDGGTVNMDDGAVIRDCYIANNTAEYGGGVQVDNGGSLYMYGGAISNNTIHTTASYESFGGGVAVLAGGVMVMEGGEISGNSVDTAAGGLYIAQGADVSIEGYITITGNTADGADNNLYLPATDKDTGANSFGVTGAVTGTVGVTSGTADYEHIIGLPSGYTIDVTDEDPFVYDDGTYDIRLKNGNLVLWWWTVDVEFNGNDVTSTNPDTETPKDQDYDTTLVPDQGSKLPDDIDISVGGELLDSDTDYTYDPDTGEVHIPGENVTGDIVIDATGDGLHTITVNTTNVTSDTTTVIVTKKDTTTITLSPANKYDLPDSVTVTGTCDYDYDPATGVITITNAKSDVTIDAAGKDIHHTIYFDPNGGTVDPTEKDIVESQLTIGTLPLPLRTGYGFVGWLDQGGNRITAATENRLTEDLYLTASWAENANISYTVRHWVEYVDSGVNPGYDDGVTAKQDSGDKSYYLFNGVTYNNGIADSEIDLHPYLLDTFADLNIDGLIPNADNQYTVTIAPDGTSVYDLFYRRNVYTVTFDPNGGDALAPNEATAEVRYGSVYGIMPAATRTGYTLIGWYTDPQGGEQRQAGDTCLVAGNHTLYAHWESNGDTAYQVIHALQPLNDNIPVTDHNRYEIHKTVPMTGTSDTDVPVYTLAIKGFASRADNPTSLHVSADGKATVTLYYDRLPVTVSYDSNGGTPVTMRSVIYYGGTVSSLAALPSRVGYACTGWYIGKLDTAQKVQAGDAINDLNPDVKPALTLYAHWTPHTYNVPLETYGGTATPATLTATYDKAIGELPTVTRKGYTFIGWELADGTPVTANMMVNTSTLIDVADDGTETAKTLYAQYTANTVTLTFDPVDGDPITNNTLVVTYDQKYSAAGSFPVATKNGFVFERWTFADGSVLTADDICTLTEDTTVYANYITKHFNVTFDPQGGSTPNPQKVVVTYGQAFGAMPSTTRSTYTFDGWFTDKTAGAQIKPETVVSFTTDTTLYAHWTYSGGSGGGGGGGGGGSTNYTITATADTGTKIDPVGKISVSSGSNKTFKISADAGHMVSDVLVDGVSAGKVTEYTFEKVKANHTIEVKAASVLTGDHIAYIVGYPDSTVRPDASITRAEAAQIFYRLLSADARSEYNTTSCHFPDVADAWYTPAVATLASMDILMGYSDGTFRPDAPIARAEFAALAARFDRLDSGDLTFTDVATSHWAYRYIASAAAKGWITGYPDGTFRPEASITRGETGKIVNAVLQRTADRLYIADHSEQIKTFTDLQTGHWSYYEMMEAVHAHDYVRTVGSNETWNAVH